MSKRKATQARDAPGPVSSSPSTSRSGAVQDEETVRHEVQEPLPKRRRIKVEEHVIDKANSGRVKKVSQKRRGQPQEAQVVETAPGSGNKDGEAEPSKALKHEQGKESVDGDESGKVKISRKRKTKEEKAAEAMPLAVRTAGHHLYIGAHVSSAGGVHNSISNSVHIGANAFALFLKSQRKWANPPLMDDHCTSFHAACESHSYDQRRHVVPHGSYLVNLAHTDKDRTAQAYESYLDDLKRCERLGINLYNIHPGNTVSNDRQTAIAHLAANINRAHKETTSVITLLENMAAGGNVLGSTFEDLRDTIALVEDKDRIGVCIDTCHAFAAGYDLRSPAAFKTTIDSFDQIVGLKYLKAMHLNDSKAPYESHRDLHANIGTGFLGLQAFHNVVNEPRFAGLPLVLETPIDVTDENGVPVKDEKGKEREDKAIWAREIKLLESLVGMAADSKEFVDIETSLARKGEPERLRLTEQQERKKEKEAKKSKSGRKESKQKKNAKTGSDDELSSSDAD